MVRHPAKSGAKPRPGQAEKKPLRTERIAKRLARAGVASRREVERLIGLGLVAVNGRILETPATVVTRDDIVTVEGQVVVAAEPTRLWRYHKPVGLMTTHKDPKERATVFENLPEGLPRVISVGRLDLSSEGLLLLTNDGALARELELPKNAWRRVYRARALGRVTQAQLDSLKDGITVEGVNYGAIEAKLDKAKEKDDGRANVWITLTLTEGKNREVRRVLEALGLKVNRLMRLAYGPFQLGTLAAGEADEVGPRVIRELLEAFIAPENLPTGDRTASEPAKAGRRPATALADPGKKPSRVRAAAERKAAEPRDDRPAYVAKKGFGEKKSFGAKLAGVVENAFGAKKSKSFSKNKAVRAGAGASRGFTGGGKRDDRDNARGRPSDDRPKRGFADKPSAFGERAKPRASGAGFGAGDAKPARAPREDRAGGFGDKPARRSAPREDRAGSFGDKPARAPRAPREDRAGGFGDKRAAAGKGFGRASDGDRPARRGPPREDRGGGFGDKPARAPRAPREDRAGGFGDKRAPAARSTGDKPFGRGSAGDKPSRSGGFGGGEKRANDRPARPAGAKSYARAAVGKPGGFKKSAPGGGFGKSGGKPAGRAGGFKAKPGGKPAAGKRPPAGPRGPRRG